MGSAFLELMSMEISPVLGDDLPDVPALHVARRWPDGSQAHGRNPKAVPTPASSRQGSTRIDARMARISAMSAGGESRDQVASITKRVPSTSRIQNSSTGSAL